MVRIAAVVEYDGARFNGWQRQASVSGIQGCVEQALSRVADHPVNVVCGGRTDAGVHAIGQVIHFDSEATRSMRSWLMGGNANLPKEVAVTWVHPVAEDFHARFSALRRSYRYVIFNRPVRPTALAWRTSWDYRPLDAGLMQESARYLLGEHDFSSYRALACQAKSPVRTIYKIDVQRRNELVIIDIQANAFLHHMVRNIVGVLCAIGAGERPSLWSKEVLERRDRTLGGVTAPPSGLYLMEIQYPEHFGIPRLPDTAMVW
ncbi:MAG: tRNA pseudouridine(38-40) synthase TruA [Gammaproteobacteria bacterium RBG_16_57_12]|nr:MAG: tRNA pseudouridine(38-40) synthase TruA [Gammaproteobacteria bacterium RBG_16_57_12]